MIGKSVKDIAPKEGNARNSEGCFYRLSDKEILFIYVKYGKGSADADYADICRIKSSDGGLTWKDEKILLKASDFGAANLCGVSALTMNNGDMGLFYSVRTQKNRLNMYLRRFSENENPSEPILCIAHEGHFVVNNDRVVRLKNGRIIIPAASHRSGPCIDGSGEFFDSVADAMYFFSDDDGYSWNISNKLSMPFTANCLSGLQEPGVIELDGGVLWGWARTDLGRQFEMFSFDMGQTWTAPQPSRFTSPLSPLSMKKLPDRRIFAVWNPIPEYNGRKYDGKVWTGGRTPLVYALSCDGGKTFSEPEIIENEESRGYCYTAIFLCEKHLLIAYCAGGQEDGTCLARTRIRRIPYEEL